MHSFEVNERRRSALFAAKQYGLNMLVYFELHADMYEAIQREKRLKKWNRAWKIELIEKINPEWKDLSSEAF